MADLRNRPKPVVLVILDGFGIAPPYPGNAITNANMLVFSRLIKAFPHCLVHASGTAVGLPHGVMGNSEVGHMNIGAGTIVYQTLPRINGAITNGSFYENESFFQALEHCKKNNSNFHIMGCTSTGNVHSTTEHLFATLHMLQKHNFDGNKVFIHSFTDGRDTNPNFGVNFLEQIENECKRTGIGKIVSIIGRYFSMDRNNKWDRIKKAYDLIVNGVGEKFPSAIEAMKSWYSRGITDEFIEPTITTPNGEPVTVKDGDVLFFFNYRADRAIQISRVFVDPEFKEFERKQLNNFFYLGMTQYDRKLAEYMNLVFGPENVNLPIGRVISEAGLRQLRLAETEKFAHVTFFLNGGRDLVFPNEDRVLVPSPKVATYDMKPEMSTFELTQVLINKIRLKIYDFIAVNIACADMVGHTGNYQAVVKAAQAIDRNLDRIILNTLAVGGCVVITADHGNAEVMIDYKTGKPHTEHTTNPVPFIYVGPGSKPIELPMGALSDIAPTILHIMGLPIPSTMGLSTNLLQGAIKKF
jgi:2,3-bisphosphoglycerate-independent phosphoglycerate mutase